MEKLFTEVCLMPKHLDDDDDDDDYSNKNYLLSTYCVLSFVSMISFHPPATLEAGAVDSTVDSLTPIPTQPQAWDPVSLSQS